MTQSRINMSNLTVENVYTRHKAKELTKKHFWKLLGMMLIVGVIVYGIMFAGMALLGLTNPDTASVSMDAAAASGEISPAFMIGYIVMMLVITLVGGGLGLGITSAMIDLCRGTETVTVGRVFSRMSQCLKAFGLSLWVGLKTLLWMLPGYVLTGVGFYFVIRTGDEMLTTLLPLCSMILLFALTIPAVYRYMLSTYILADKPDTGVFACVNESKALMKGHKWQAFKLVIPTLLILYGLMIVFVLIVALLLAVVVDVSAALTVILAILFFVAFFGLVLYFAIRVGLAYCVFYLNRQGEGDAEEPAAEAAPAE